MLLVNSSSIVALPVHPGEMPPCLICAFVICTLVLWTTHIIGLFAFNDAHLAECSLLGVYGLLGGGGCYIKATLQLHGCQKTQWKCSPVLVIIC